MIVVEETHSKPINVPGVLPLNAAITDYGYERGTAEFSAHLSTRITLKSNTINSLSNVFRPVPFLFPRSGELRTQKLKSHLVRTQSSNVLPFKPGVGQYIAIHATLTARDFFLAYFYPSSPFTCIFSKISPNFFLCWPAE